MAEESFNFVEEPEASSVTVKDDCSKVGGYDCDFVESPVDDMLCKICHYAARDPVLAVCCGHSFCGYCLECYKQLKVIGNSSCPYCREEKFQAVPDKRTKRSVLNLKVFCPHKCHGCEWIGELRSMEDHINKNSNDNTGCPFTELQCSNGCGVVIQRRLVEGHLKSECELRKVKCEYCNTTGSYQWINSSHQEECPKYPVECPSHCEAGHVRREEMSRHLEECPLAIVECPYAAVGCESVVRRKEQMEHVMVSVEQHMQYNKNAILANQKEFQKMLDAKEQALKNVKKDLQDTKEKLEESQEIQSQLNTAINEKGRELDEVRKNAEENHKTLQEVVQQLKDMLEGTLRHQLEVNTQLQLQVDTIFSAIWPLRLNHLANSGNEVVPVVIRLAEFEKYKKTMKWLISTGFYTRDGGYKMCLGIYPHGLLATDHVTVLPYLMKGNHDDHLTWPIVGTLTVQLLNQISDSNHSEPVRFHFDGGSSSFAPHCHRVVIGTRSSTGIQLSQSIPHKRLSYDADKRCQYLKDDCVFFRVCDFQ